MKKILNNNKNNKRNENVLQYDFAFLMPRQARMKIYKLPAILTDIYMFQYL